MFDYNFKELVRILTNIDSNIRLLMPYKCTEFQPDRSTHLRVRVDFVICAKRRRRRRRIRRKKTNKNWNFGLSYLGNAWRNLLQFWNPASPYRRAVPQQIWWSSGKRSLIYECVKIATLLVLLIYSLPFARARGRTTHYRVSWLNSRFVVIFVVMWEQIFMLQLHHLVTALVSSSENSTSGHHI